jgi:DNA-binding NarL/FixJ family response regulator
MSLRVVLADDQALVRGGFRKILEAGPEIAVVGEAEDGREAIELVRQLRPDVVVMDIRMPRVDGLEAARTIAVEHPATRTLVVTTFGLDEYVLEALRAGASGFLLKDAPPEDLLAAVRAVARGQALLDPAVTQAVVAELARRPRLRPDLGRSLDLLTAREREILTLLAQGMSNADIARTLVIAEGTAKTHVASILGKLRLRNRIQCVIFAYESGLIRAGDSGGDADARSQMSHG